jgi:hypothetical protein
LKKDDLFRILSSHANYLELFRAMFPSLFGSEIRPDQITVKFKEVRNRTCLEFTYNGRSFLAAMASQEEDSREEDGGRFDILHFRIPMIMFNELNLLCTRLDNGGALFFKRYSESQLVARGILPRTTRTGNISLDEILDPALISEDEDRP